MSFEIREWRALAIGWAAALAYTMAYGLDWGTGTISIGVCMAVWILFP